MLISGDALLSSPDPHALFNAYPDSADARASLDALQRELRCCGGFDLTRGYNTWKDVAGMELSVPDSCCLTETEGCGQSAFKYANIHHLMPNVKSEF